MTAGFRAAALAALLVSSSAAVADPQRTGSPDPSHGRLVAIGGWMQTGRAACTQCHGLDGLGDTSGAFPRLSGLDGWTLYKALRDYAAGLRPNAIMQQVASQLSDQEMQDVAAYYASLDDLPYLADPQIETGVRQAGAAIVAIGLPEKGVAACSGCHGRDGAGAGVLYPRIAGQYAPYLELQLRLWKEGRRDGDPMNVMEQVAKGLSDAEIRAVSLYLASVDPTAVPPAPLQTPPLPDPSAGVAPPYLEPTGSTP